MKEQYRILLRISVLLLGFLVFVGNAAFAKYDRFLSSPNPVGSGARALGMGGAFIGVADDATAASWNPAGLVQLKKPEVSVVGSLIWRNDNYDIEEAEQTIDSQQIFLSEINYLSVVYPFSFYSRNMVISLNYQKLYDYSLEQDVTSRSILMGMILDTDYQKKRTGTLAPFGVAYSLQIIPRLSFGITCNFWQPHHNTNKVIIKDTCTIAMDGQLIYHDFRKSTNAFEGFNYNIGLLWRPINRFSIGMVYKSYFNFDIERTLYQESTNIGEDPIVDNYQMNEEVRMPESYGIGFCHKVNDNFKVSADIYITNWDDYIYTNREGERYSPITGSIETESDVDATTQVHTGLEYLLINKTKQLSIPLRFGLFLDPIPDKRAPINVYGVSSGAGIALGNWALDGFYQFKFSEDIHPIEERRGLIPKKIDEHTIYVSIIYYL